jgi:hypothetical protein
VEEISGKNPSGIIKVQIFLILLGENLADVCLDDGIQSQGISRFSSFS